MNAKSEKPKNGAARAWKRLALSAAVLSALALPSGKAEAREFLNTFLHINLGWSYDLPYGNQMKAERREPLILTIPGLAQIARPNHVAYSFNINADIVPFPSILFAGDRAAVKLGLRAGYRFSFIRQSLPVKRGYGKDYTSRSALFSSESPLFGPVIRIAPWVREDPTTHEFTARGGITLFALYGPLINARIKGRPNITDAANDMASLIFSYTSQAAGLSTLLQEYTKLVYFGVPASNARGDRIDVGIGGEVGVFYFNLGLNLIYSRMWIRQEFATHYTVGKSTHLDVFMAEVYLGLPVEWSFVPKTY